MNLIYGNDGNSYRLFAKSAGISDAAEERLKNSYMKYAFPENTSAYSSIETQPECISYVTSDLNRTLPAEYVILTKSGRMTQYSTPSYYFCAKLSEPADSFWKDDFFSLFNVIFPDSYKSIEFTNADVDELVYETRTDMSVSDAVLTPEQIKETLAAFLYSERRGKPLKIICDRSGDEYNKRSREILATIYHYLPYDYRRRYGFITYMSERQSSAPKIMFEIYDRSQCKSTDFADIDLESPKARIPSGTVKEQIENYVKAVCSMNEDQRRGLFDIIQRENPDGKINIVEIFASFYSKQRWESDPVEELLPEWADTVFVGRRNKNALYNKAIPIINKRLDPDMYNRYLFQQMNRCHARLSAPPEEIRKLIVLSDHVDKLSLNTEQFWDYFIHNFKDLFQDRGALKEEIDKLRTTDIGSPGYRAVLDEIVSRLENEHERQLQSEHEENKRREEETSRVLNEELLRFPFRLTGNRATEYLRFYLKYSGENDKKTIDSRLNSQTRNKFEEMASDPEIARRDIAEAKEYLRILRDKLDKSILMFCQDCIQTAEKNLAKQESKSIKNEVLLLGRKDYKGFVSFLEDRTKSETADMSAEITVFISNDQYKDETALHMTVSAAKKLGDFLFGEPYSCGLFWREVFPKDDDLRNRCTKRMIQNGLFLYDHLVLMLDYAERTDDTALIDQILKCANRFYVPISDGKKGLLSVVVGSDKAVSEPGRREPEKRRSWDPKDDRADDRSTGIRDWMRFGKKNKDD